MNEWKARIAADAAWDRHVDWMNQADIMAATAAVQDPDGALLASTLTGSALRDTLQPTAEQEHYLMRALRAGSIADATYAYDSGILSTDQKLALIVAQTQEQANHSTSTITGAIMLPPYAGMYAPGDDYMGSYGLAKESEMTYDALRRKSDLVRRGYVDAPLSAYEPAAAAEAHVRGVMEMAGARDACYRRGTEGVQAAATRRELWYHMHSPEGTYNNDTARRSEQTLTEYQMGMLHTAAAAARARQDQETEAMRYLYETAAGNLAALGDAAPSAFVSQARADITDLQGRMALGLQLGPRVAAAAGAQVVLPSFAEQELADMQSAVRTGSDLRSAMHQLPVY